MKRHKPKERDRVFLYSEEDSCEGCRYYHSWFGVCCNGESEQRGDVSHRCRLYDSEGKDEEDGNGGSDV